jgi:hypothetical protein
MRRPRDAAGEQQRSQTVRDAAGPSNLAGAPVDVGGAIVDRVLEPGNGAGEALRLKILVLFFVAIYTRAFYLENDDNVT